MVFVVVRVVVFVMAVVFVMLVVMVLVEAFLLRAERLNAHVIADHAAFDRFLHRNRNVLQPQRVHLAFERVRRVQQRGERAHQHVARRAHSAIQIQYFHAHFSVFCSSPGMVLMRCARKPAPKPLSILTTLTPLAHEFSIESSAATP